MDGSGCVGFNKRRGEGRDRIDKPLQLKAKKLNPVNTISYVQILGTGMDTQDTSPSVLLFFDNQRIIFNSGEGFQRFCTEHKIKLSKLDHIFLSRICSETVGGLPGLLLTLAGVGEEGMSVNIWGPSDLNYLLDAMRFFIRNSAMVHTKSFGPPSSLDAVSILDSAKFTDPIVLIDDEVVKLSAILLQPSSNTRVGTAAVSVIYICELPEIRGKFDPAKAVALGLKAGSKFRDLQLGNSVKSDCKNITVHPSDVMGPPIPGPIVILVDCPTESHLQEILSIKSLSCYYADFSNNASKTVNCIVHLSPVSVTSSPNYHKWMGRFGSSAQHIMAGHDMKNVEVPILRSSARIAARLNYLCPQFFPASGFRSLDQLYNFTPESIASCEGHVSKHCERVPAENLLKFSLRPYSQLGLDRSGIPNPMAPPEIIDELLSEIPEIADAAQHISQSWQGTGELNLDGNILPSCLENIRRDDLEIVLLGTGSAQPSKYRNVSSIYINLFSKGSLLLDCGEGTLGQLKIRYGLGGADIAVKNLTCIWISHIHADHHAGLTRILVLRRDLLKGVPHEPLLVMGPRRLERFLNAYQRLEDLDMKFLDCNHTTKPNKNLQKAINEAGLEALVSFPVIHCPQAFGVVLKAAERINSVGKIIPGWKIVYSGDTRPCPELLEASCDATILIHEATFEDGLMDEAIAKNHSTTSEAIEAGTSAGVYRIILTHFSQRYPKIPVFDETHMDKTSIAFDLMSVNIADLYILPKILPFIKLLFRDDIILDESDDVAPS